jgi:hypothetical protein
MDARVKPAHGDFGKRRCQWPRQSFYAVQCFAL